jgi:radical SAM superfamily enzyme YgiQ (UPF0313 family)
MTLHERRKGPPDLLCIVPPYPVTVPPAGPAALLAYLRAAGVDTFGFVDLRLWAPQTYAPTYAHTGPFGQAFVMDVPDLPLVLMLLDDIDHGRPAFAQLNPLFSRYCLERAISPAYLQKWLRQLDRMLQAAFDQLADLDLVGFSVWTSNYLATLMAAAHLKRDRRRAPLVVVGGPQVTESPAAARLALKSGLVDCVALGEGEETLRSVSEQFDRRTRTLRSHVAGTMIWDASRREFSTAPRALLKLATLPPPDFDDMDLGAYEAGNGHRRILPFQLSRGCTDKCTFCSEWQFWERFRADTVEHALEQTISMRERYGAQGFACTDSLLNGVPDRLRQFAEGLVQKNLDLTWGGFMRARIDVEAARLLRRSGFVLAFIGIESFADETLQMMNKRRTMADNVQALEAFLSAGIAVRAGFIPGFPGDTRERFLRTAEVFRQLQEKYPGQLALGIEPFVVSPGQPMFRELSVWGLTTTNWSSEYLGEFPAYRDITQSIPCTVEGPNQGLERAGQYRIAVAMSQHGSGAARTEQMASNITRADFMYYSYNPTELVSDGELSIESISEGVYVGCFKTNHGTIYCCLLSESDRERYQEHEREERLRQPWASPHGLLSSAWFRDYLADVESAHLIRPRSDAVRLWRPRFATEPDPRNLIVLSPFAVARRFEQRAGVHIIVLHAVTRRVVVVSDDLASALQRLQAGPASFSELFPPSIGAIGTAQLMHLFRAGLMSADRASRPPQGERSKDFADRFRAAIPLASRNPDATRA